MVRACGGAGGRRPDWWVVCGPRGLWLRCRWSWSPDRRVARGLQGPAGLRGDAPSEARGVDGERAGRPRAARRSGGGVPSEARWDGGCGAGGRWQGQGGPRDRSFRAEGSRVAISRAGRRPPAHRAATESKTCARIVRRSGGVGRVDGERAGRPRAARRSDGCAITLPRLAIAWARTPVLSPAACTTLEGSS